jgi:hypothetical protein
MPISLLHKSKLKKNLATLAIVFCFILVVWAITVLKIQEYGVAVR